MTDDTETASVGPGTARLRILTLLKRLGPVPSEVLAKELNVTAMAVRQHLAALEAEGLAGFETVPAGRGRPAKLWSALPAADGYFTDAHAALTADLLAQMKAVFGEQGLDKILRQRTKEQVIAYRKRMAKAGSLHARLELLARIRSEEGYMAQVRGQADGSILFVENHCPVCAAARACGGLCREELALFRALLSEEADIVRTDHILTGARRCVYRIARKQTGKVKSR